MSTLRNLNYDTVSTWINDKGIDALIAIVIGVVVYYIGKRLLGRLIKQIIKGARHREWHRKDIEKRQNTLVQLFATIWRLVVILSVGYAVLQALFGDTVSNTFAPLFASAGIIGIAVGIGAQSLIRDFLSGIFIISENQYRVGDIVDIEGASGTVERIGTRSTILRDVDGNVHYFPNGMVQHVINKTMGYSMARFSVSLHPSSDIEKISEIIDEIGNALAEEEAWKAKILEAPNFVSIGDFNGTAVEVIVAGKTQPSDQWAVIAEMRRRLLSRFEHEGVKLATPPTTPAGKSKK
ncbi:MAG: mechanosensitive ion channel protein MscS, small conductance mechanosensitive channel [Candidatus Saccharibacteria bacterium]|nr:mechanosensitive ion channel protein MscS, small conductance mechanosensitive channel [Candidatus Saccharibacteria bacterium]